MNSFGDRLKDLSDKLGKTNKQIAEELDLSKSQMSHYTTGLRSVPSDLLQKIVDTYKINPQFLFYKNAPLYKEEATDVESYYYLPTSISAGLPITVESITDAEKITLPNSVMGKWAGNKDIYITKINGDSMDKVMPDGSLIAVKPINLSELKDGDMVVFSNNHEYGVKYYKKSGDKLVFKPASHNDDHYDQEYNKDDIEFHGKVVMYIVVED